MAQKSTKKTDLLVRVRYTNPLPAPPFPPKLLKYQTDVTRYSTYEFLEQMLEEKELPLLVDQDQGMAIDLGMAGGPTYWEGGREGIALNPKTPRPPLEDADLELLVDPIPVTSSSLQGNNDRRTEVSWLRRTEYLGSDTISGGKRGLQDAAHVPRNLEMDHDTLSIEQRVEAIEKTFAAANAPLQSLKHPHSADVVPIDSFPIFPNEDMWDTDYQITKFHVYPGEAEDETPTFDPRITSALLRTVQVPGYDTRYSLYLPSDNDLATSFSALKLTSAPSTSTSTATVNDTEDATMNPPPISFTQIRDYEMASIRQLNSEFMVTFEEGLNESEIVDDFEEHEASASAKSKKREKAAYYVPLESIVVLRQRRRDDPQSEEDYRAYAEESGVGYYDTMNVHWGKPLSEISKDTELQVKEKRSIFQVPNTV